MNTIQREFSIEAFTANVDGVGMKNRLTSQRRVRKLMAEMKEEGSDFCGLNEMFPIYYGIPMRRVFTKKGGWRRRRPIKKTGAGHSCAAAVKDRWLIEKTELVKLSDTIYRGRRAVIDSRYMLELTLRLAGTEHRVVLMVWHLAPEGSSYGAEVRDKCTRARAKSINIVKARINKTSHPVVLLGDDNEHDSVFDDEIDGRKVYYKKNTEAHGLDKVYVIDGWHVKVLTFSGHIKKLPTDHKAGVIVNASFATLVA